MSETDAQTPDFAALGLPPAQLQILSELGYEQPTPIQTESIPVLLEGRDVLASAATGTGKTAAFTLPFLQQIQPGAGPVQALVLCPTRELALQVARAVKAYAGSRVKVLPVFGGQSIGHQLRGLARGVDVVVGTPGRVLDHLERGSLDLSGVRHAVLDEADEMLDMGFIEDIETILGRTPDDRQTALFSATFPPRIESLAQAHLRDPLRLTTESPRKASAQVTQSAYLVRRAHKVAALDRLLDLQAPEAAIIFCRTRLDVDSLTEELALRGFRPQALHGGLSQAQRDRVMGLFRQGGAELLIATDVAARGLDVDHVSHVVNFDIPESPQTYVHRIGRTGRAGREGTALTLVDPRERRQLGFIERITGQRIDRRYLPTLDELEAAQQDRLLNRLREQLEGADTEDWRGHVQTLVAEGHDPADLAAAALALADTALGRDVPHEEIPAGPPPKRADRHEHTDRAGRPRAERPDRGPRHDRPERRERPRSDGRGPRPVPAGRTRLFIMAGRRDGIRPGDLVGAIANQAGLPGNAIGPIRVDERYAKVEVPSEAAEKVIDALRDSGVKGRRVKVDYDRH